MIGAVIGDIVGSKYEFNNIRTKDFDIFADDVYFTDDTVLTCAVIDALLHYKDKGSEAIAKCLQTWCREYPNAGYGGKFSKWIWEENPKPYNSFGNGALMRISPCAALARTEREVILNAHIITEVTHNHPKALEGAEIIALCIWYAMHDRPKAFIKDYVSRYYNLDFDYEELKANNQFDETVEGTLPKAVYCFLISENFEDCLKTAISIGGDSDTIAAIACSIAQAYYKTFDKKLVELVYNHTDDKIQKLLLEELDIYNANIDEYDEPDSLLKIGDCTQLIIDTCGLSFTNTLLEMISHSINHAAVDKDIDVINHIKFTINNIYTHECDLSRHFTRVYREYSKKSSKDEDEYFKS